MLFDDRFRGCRVLVTGHTGFKGSWLALWLSKLGADVVGLSLPAETSPNHWELLGLDMSQHIHDIRDSDAITRTVAEVKPEIIFHLAAQSLVRRSYSDPLQTWSTNVFGTASVLEACRQSSSVRAILVVTTDKCYENKEWMWGYRETDPLGGHDPYSASKASAELVVASYRKSFFNTANAPLLATARAGNVVGGGDWSEDRLIPDLVRALAKKAPLEIRSPNATRPWQHVLESLSGYLLLGRHLLDGDRAFADCWNFGPDMDGNRTVSDVLLQMKTHWPEIDWRVTVEASQEHEANLLYLDSSKAKRGLGWRPIWNMADTVAATADWYRTYHSTGKVSSCAQIDGYVQAALKAGVEWSRG